MGDNLGTEDRWAEGTPLASNRLGMHGVETQAHAGMEVHRMVSVDSSAVAYNAEYQALYQDAFPADANPIDRLNAALAIAAFERTVLPTRAPWQRWLRGDSDAMTDHEKTGAILFFGKAGCIACHTGPALNSMEFYALGMNDLDAAHDLAGVDLRPTGGTVPHDVRRGRGGFTGRPEDDFKFKTPQIYNLVDTPFYGHGASFASVRDVVEYKNRATPESPVVPTDQLPDEFRPLGLTADEIAAIVDFIENALYDPELMRCVPDRLPTGSCTPVNDPAARKDLGCGQD